jgi:hypothetical protein
MEILETTPSQQKRSPKGVRPAINNRDDLEGILWVLRAGAN